ncbi:MAG TPA: TAXI family TRAP transporter solute-binding subunit [Nitrospirota bacterium]|nr:TAXI family TRAP transporter solute-binding subunit [Nitrospirota bacterium]
MGTDRKIPFTRVQALFTEIFGLGRAAALSAILLISLFTIFAVFWFFYSAPPHTLTITSGPEDSIFRRNAEKYAKILARSGVKLKVLPSQGSLENIKRLANPAFKVDIGFVQGGVAGELDIERLNSLGSVSYEPLMVFYRGTRSLDVLSGLNGKRLAIGPEGSGTRSLALVLLAANGIEPRGATRLVDLDAEDAAKALLENSVDAVFLMGDAASPQIMRKLMQTPGIRLFDFIQADGYTRRISYLNKLALPRGSIDFGKDIPSHDVSLIGPTVELIARTDLHPALSDLLLEAASEVHGGSGLFKRQGEFPAPLEHELHISADAVRYYKSGKIFLYRYLPFRLASLMNRILVVAVPMAVVLLPGLRIIPALYRWRIKLRIYRWYRALLMLERDLITRLAREEREELFGRLDHIEEEVNKMKMPASFADQFYVLREHIDFVRDRLIKSTELH